MNKTCTFSTISMTLALLLLAGRANAEQPIVADSTQAEIDRELAEMAAIAAAKLVKTAPVAPAPIQANPDPAPTPAIVAEQPAQAPAFTSQRSSVLGDTIAQLVPTLLKRRQATISPENATAISPDLDRDNLSREPGVSASADLSTGAASASGRKIILPARETETTTTSFGDVYALNQRWKEQDRAAAESRARRDDASIDQSTFASQEPSTFTVVIDPVPEPRSASSESWRMLAEPGQQHQLLDIFAGTWQVEGRFETQPGQPPEIASGTMVSTWQLGQRWLRQEYTGSMPSLGRFEGLGFFGYDNAKGKFVTTWMDTLSTTAMTSHGLFNENAGSFTLTGSFTGTDGVTYTQRQVVTVQTRDSYTIALTLIGPDQVETPSGTVTYTRIGGMRTFTNEGGSSLQP